MFLGRIKESVFGFSPLRCDNKTMSKETEKLEIKISYLERENALLNEIVTDLNKRVGVLSSQFEELKKKVKDLMDNESEERESRRPPHY